VSLIKKEIKELRELLIWIIASDRGIHKKLIVNANYQLQARASAVPL